MSQKLLKQQNCKRIVLNKGINFDLANNKTPTRAKITNKKIAILETIVVVLNIIICVFVLNEL